MGNRIPAILTAAVLLAASAGAAPAAAATTASLHDWPAPLAAPPGVEAPEGVAANWIEHFDLYATGSQMHGQGGWEGWNGNPASGALTTSLFARSTPNSVEISPTTDLVHPFAGYTTGTWTFTAHHYIPSATTGLLYFILLNTYPNPSEFGDWSTQLCFDTVNDVVRDDTTGACDTTPTLPLVYDQWVEIRVVIDLDNDSQTVYYNGQLFFQAPWSSHLGTGGVVNLAAVDLYAHPPSGPSAIYFDDLSLSNLPFLDGFEGGNTNEWHATLP